MVYKVSWEEEALDNLAELPHIISLPLKKKIDSYLTQSPKELGKALTGEYKGQYRYRYGDYRVIYTIDLKNKQVIVYRVGHRKEVY